VKFQTILAIESAVGDGSISIWRDDPATSIDRNHSDASRAEKIIIEIDGLIQEAGFSKNDLDLIAVSIGPGSYSGIRIGVSTALGLGHALGIPVVGVSVLDALASSVTAKKVIAVAPIGRSDLAWQVFEANEDGTKRALTEPALDSITTFPESLDAYPEEALVAPSHWVESLKSITGGHRKLMDIGWSLASAIGRLASQGGSNMSRPKPIYMRSAVARSVNS
jgi:tRNA threonylcarbamoyladenosine biosynthesis protein TsaB